MAIPGGGSFPEGMRVLVVDDEPLCLMILDRMLRQCKYNGKKLCLDFDSSPSLHLGSSSA